jgi:acetate kinase
VRRILTINSGSSSIKFSLYEMGQAERLLLAGVLQRIGQADGHFLARDGLGQTLDERQLELPDHRAALRVLFDWLQRHAPEHAQDGVGHRIVHGGATYTQPHLITPDVVRALTDLIPLAPEHLPHEIAAIQVVGQDFPGVPQVACFDTAFHRQMPLVAQMYALPRSLWEQGVLRYGFHGLSYEYIVGELAAQAGAAVAHGRVIAAHLGNGASMAALHQGRSVDTTMGFTPTGGLVMSTRSGDLDPGVLLYLLEEHGYTPVAARTLVSHQAGLLGVSGTSSDMCDLLGREPADPFAAQAVALYCYQARKFLAGLAATLGGLDTLVFTAGIGENAPVIRARICADLEFLGIHLDATRNAANAPIISADAGPVTVRVIPTNEELIIARHTNATVGQFAPPPDEAHRQPS